MTDMADHNTAFESIIQNAHSITTAKEEDLKFYACAFVKPGWREGEGERKRGREGGRERGGGREGERKR